MVSALARNGKNTRPGLARLSRRSSTPRGGEGDDEANDAERTTRIFACNRRSQSYPSPAAEPSADGSTTVYFSPTQPAGVKRGNWIQTLPGKGFFPLLRLYSPLEAFFTKTWRPSEIVLVQ
jgi:hypothetical protein